MLLVSRLVEFQVNFKENTPGKTFITGGPGGSVKRKIKFTFGAKTDNKVHQAAE